MNLIKVHYGDSPIETWINPEHIVQIDKCDTGGSSIRMSTNLYGPDAVRFNVLWTMESPEEIVMLCGVNGSLRQVVHHQVSDEELVARLRSIRPWALFEWVGNK